MLKRIFNVSTGTEETIEVSDDEIASFGGGVAPVVRRRFLPLEFLDLFGEEVQLAVAAAAMSSPEVKLWYDRVLAASYITIEDPRVEAGLSALVVAGLLAEHEKAAVVAAMEGE